MTSIHTSFCELFCQMSLKHPKQIAVSHDDHDITYEQLKQDSDAFALHLKQVGIIPGDIVGLMIYNSIDLVVAMLGIWKANAVYLPLDPNYPKNSIFKIVDNAQPKLLITNASLGDRIQPFKLPYLYIETFDSKINISSDLIQFNNSHDLAYIMYTSGSTGTPKGIVVDHQGLYHAAQAYKQLHNQPYTALVSGSISFDPSLLTIIHTLLCGGTICLYDNKDGIDTNNIKKVADLILLKKINYVLSTPSFYKRLLDLKINFSSLQLVDLCGEQLNESLVKNHTEFAPEAALYNVYGPTEYAIGVSASKIYDPKKNTIEPITIGKPFASNEMYVFDVNLTKTPPGVHGEIYVSGPGLSKGYLHLQELTKEKFINIKHKKLEQLFYRTGDIGYYLENGDIAYVGRKDFQVKISGHRVEIEEIENAALKIKPINQFIVVCHAPANEENRLIAFYSSDEDLNSQNLSENLKTILPSYMIPERFIKIDDWPITKHGKIDRKRLAKHFIS